MPSGPILRPANRPLPQNLCEAGWKKGPVLYIHRCRLVAKRKIASANVASFQWNEQSTGLDMLHDDSIVTLAN